MGGFIDFLECLSKLEEEEEVTSAETVSIYSETTVSVSDFTDIIGNFTSTITEIPTTESEPTDDPEYNIQQMKIFIFLLLRGCVLIPSLIICFIVMCMEVRKTCCTWCLRGHFAMIIPVNFLECKQDRFVTLSAFAIISIDVLAILFGQSHLLPPGSNSIVKVLLKMFLVLLVCLICLPFFICYNANTYVSLIFGILYVIIYALVMNMDQFLQTQAETEEHKSWRSEAAEHSVDAITFIFGIIMIIGYARKIYLKARNRDKDSIEFRKYERQYLKELLSKRVMVVDAIELQKGKCLSCWHKHVYRSMPGFRYSLSLVVSITVGIVAITHLYVQYLAMFAQLYHFSIMLLDIQFTNLKDIPMPNILAFFARILFKGVTFSDTFQMNLFDFLREQVVLILGCVLAGCVVSYFSVFFISLHILKSYRVNILSLVQRKDEENLMRLKSSSNVSLVVSAIQYAGYQVAYLIWGAHLQFFTISLVLIIISELIILPLKYAFGSVIIAILDIILPIIIVMVITKGVQFLLVKFVFLQDKGAVMALDNRKGFFTMMYFMFFYNVFMGLFSCLMRVIKSVVFGLCFLPRLDRSIFPRSFEHLDGGFKSYNCLLKLEAIQSNVIVTTFAKELTKRISVKEVDDNIAFNNLNLKNSLTEKKEPSVKLRSLRARNRWLVAYTLLKNPELKKQRGPTAIGADKCSEFESTV